MSSGLNIKGMAQLQAALATLPVKMENNILRAGMRAAMKVIEVGWSVDGGRSIARLGMIVSEREEGRFGCNMFEIRYYCKKYFDDEKQRFHICSERGLCTSHSYQWLPSRL